MAQLLSVVSSTLPMQTQLPSMAREMFLPRSPLSVQTLLLFLNSPRVLSQSIAVLYLSELLCEKRDKLK